MGTMLERTGVRAWFLFSPPLESGRDIASAGRRSLQGPTMMNKNVNVVGASALALMLSFGFVACGDDDDTPMMMSDGGRDAGRDGGGDDAGRDAGRVDGGADGGTADGGGLDGGSTDGGDADAGLADAGPIDCTPTKLLVTTSDFTTGGLATFDLETGAVTLSPTAAADQDTLPVRAGCDTYLVEGGSGRVRRQVGGDPLTTAISIDVNPAGTPAGDTYVASPQVVVEAGAATFVTRYSLQSAARIDPIAGTTTGAIDFTPLAATADIDSVDMSAALYNGGRLLVALGRFYFPSPTFALTYGGPSVIAVVDPIAGTLVDVDATTPGTQGITLPTGNPRQFARLDDDVVLVTCTDDAFDDTDGVLYAIDVPSGNVTATAATEATMGAFNGLVTTDGGRVFLAAGGAVLELMADTGIVIGTLVPATVGVTALAIHADSAYVVTSAGLRVWLLSSGLEKTTAPVTFGTLPIYGIALAR